METCHESAYRRSHTGRIDRRSHIRPFGERGPDVAGELVIRVERLLTERPRKPPDVAPSGYGRDSGRFRFAPRTWLARGGALSAE